MTFSYDGLVQKKLVEAVKDGLKNRNCDKPTGHFSPGLAIPFPVQSSNSPITDIRPRAKC